MPRVHIIILNWNGWKDTIECLESVYKSDYSNYQVVVCDNDSQDGSVEKILSWSRGELAAKPSSEDMAFLSTSTITKPLTTLVLDAQDTERESQHEEDLILINTGGNLGFAGGNNVGLKFALQQTEHDYVWLLNNDTVIMSDTLRKMVQHSLSLSDAGIPNTCGSVQRYYYAPETVQCLGGFTFNKWTGICSATFGMGLPNDANIDHESYRQRLHAIHGCSWLLPITFLREIGLMEDDYFLYYEEIDWALRSEGRYKLTYADDAIVFHKEGGSIGSRSLNRRGSLLSEFYMNRNKFKVAKKFFPWTIPTVFMFVLLIAVRRLIRGERDTALLLAKVAFGKSTY